MEGLFEAIFAGVFMDIVLLIGITVRWLLLSGIRIVMGKEIVPYRRFRVRYLRDSDPSNFMSNKIIHAILGFGVLFAVIFVVAKSFG